MRRQRKSDRNYVARKQGSATMTGNVTVRRHRRKAVFGALLLSSILTPLAFAQDTAPAATEPAAESTDGSEEITVTAQRKSERLQKVPIAVSAFSQDQLQKQKIDGGPNLVLAIPNVNFSKGNFTGSNFSIRGIGSKLVAASGDSATGVHINGSPLTANNLFEADFFDMERVEVLRGPQGTLYGRNATGGVVNLITAKPNFDEMSGNFRAEYGNYNSIKLRGMFNAPLGDMFALRVAGTYLKRDGFGDNLVTGNDSDDRDLWATRATLGFQPDETFSAYFVWDHFDEDDSRSRIGKQLCSKDSGPANVGGTAFSGNANIANIQQGFFSQGCQATPVTSANIFGTVDSRATLGGLFGYFGGFLSGDAYAGKVQTSNVRDIESAFDPIYRSKTDIYQLIMDWDVSPNVRLSSLTSYTEFDLFTRQDYNRYAPTSTFNVVPNPNALVAFPGYAAIYAGLFPGGVVNDPQNGASNRFRTSDISSAFTEQFTQEFRVSTDFEGPVNFSLGANYLNLDATGDYYVMFNTGTAFYQLCGAIGGIPGLCAANVFVDPNADPDRSGHNYYDSYSPYNLTSSAVFGEVYWEATDNFKITAGIRYTDDDKTIENHAVTLGTPGSGIAPAVYTNVRFKELTGRLGFDWQPDLSFTDSTLIYGFYSRGYKAGGLNSPCSAGPGVVCGPPDFKPEFINSYELGFKNTLNGGTAQLNLSLFHYDYQGYQVSKIVNRASTNENIDASITGAEFESVWNPIKGLRLNANIGYLTTEIDSGTSIDTFNRTQSNPNLVVVKSSAASNCVVTLTAAQGALALSNALSDPSILLGVCSVTNFATAGTPLLPGGPVAVGSNAFGALVSDGVAVDLSGNELPNAPEWTISLGAQYTFEVSDGWDLTARVDYYKQTGTFSRIYNAGSDEIPGWENVNITLTLANEDNGWTIDAYVKNATDETALTDTYLTDDSSGLFRNGFYTDPRTFGLAVSYEF
jgi:outer membrane receptor protein involved in Fe transport